MLSAGAIASDLVDGDCKDGPTHLGEGGSSAHIGNSLKATEIIFIIACS